MEKLVTRIIDLDIIDHVAGVLSIIVYVIAGVLYIFFYDRYLPLVTQLFCWSAVASMGLCFSEEIINLIHRRLHNSHRPKDNPDTYHGVTDDRHPPQQDSPKTYSENH